MAVVVYVPSRLGEGFFTDLPAPTAGDDVKAITYDHGTGAFVYMPFETAGAVATHVGLADPHTQYALESVLGTAAFLNVGTGANNIVQLNGSSQLPAVDGSLLTGISGGGVAGSDTQVIFNNAGASGGAAGLTYDTANSHTDMYSATKHQLHLSGSGRIAGDSAPATSGELRLGSRSDATRQGSIHYYGNGPTLFFDNGHESGSWVFRNAAGSTPVARFAIGPAGQLALTSRMTITDGTQEQLYVSGWDSAGGASDNNGELRLGGAARRGIIHFDGVSNHAVIFDNESTIAIRNFLFRSRTGGVTTEIMRIVGATNVVGVGVTDPVALLDLAASTTVRASLRIRSGVAPTAPNAGDVWFDGTHFYGYTGSATVQLDN